MLYDTFRLLGLLTGYPAQLFIFKRKTYYEDGASKKSFKKGGKLIISNHFNMLDYVMTSFIAFPRKLNVVTSEAPFKKPFFRFGMKFFGAIQANRETKNMRFMDISADTIKKGQLVIIYPEGRNTPDGNMHEFKHSYIVIAHRANCPIIPSVTDGNYGVFKRTSVIVGREIDISQYITSDRRTPTREELKNINDVVYSKMLQLRKLLDLKKSESKRKWRS